MESAWFRQSGSEWVERDRHFQIEITFDQTGHKVNQEGQWGTGAGINPYAKCQAKYVSDDKERATEEYEVCGDQENLVRKFIYEDDPHGNWTRKTTLVPIDASGEFRKDSIGYRTLVYFE